MLTRRSFLKGLIASIASAALVKNGIAQPEQIVAEPERRVFDMAANTWRETEMPSMLFGYPVREWKNPPAFVSDIMLAPLEHVNCRCALPESDDPGGYLIPQGMAEKFLVALRRPYPPLDSFGISSDAVAKQIRELQTRTEIKRAFHQAIFESVRRWEDEILHGAPGDKMPAGIIRPDA